MELGRGDNLTDAFKELEGNEELDKELAALKARVKAPEPKKAAPKKAAKK